MSNKPKNKRTFDFDRYLIVCLFSVALLGLPNIANAKDFFTKKYEGWHWYEAKSDKVLSEEEKMSTLTPTEQIMYLRYKQELNLHAAIANPTDANIVEYLKIQKLILEKGENFSTNYSKVIYTHPELNEGYRYPTNHIGSQIYHDKKHKEQKAVLQKLSKEYGLFYFYKAGCQYCQRFTPIVKQFATEHGFSLIPISMDGSRLPELNSTRDDHGIATKLNIRDVPSLIAAHPRENKYIPLAYGFTSLDEIESKAVFLSKFNSGDGDVKR